MTADRRIRSIAIIGGGSAGWMAAATLARLIGTRDTAITLVESDAIGTVGVGEATIPQMATFNRMLGIDEDRFVAETEGSFKLGIEFVDWRRPGHRYFHPFGSYGVPMGGVSFHAQYLRLAALCEAPPIEAFSMAATAARAGRFMRAVDTPNSPLRDIHHAYHFDAALYARFLRRHAEARGVVRREGRVVAVEREPQRGHVASVTMADGGRIAADLFVDCSGFRALLIGDAMGQDFVDWSHWLPCDRAVAVPCAHPGDGRGEIAPFTRATARGAGWQWRIPLRHRIGNGLVYASAHLSDDAAAATLLAGLDGPPTADPRVIRFRTGHRRRFWDGNVVALGLAAGFLEPLESTSLWLVQSGLSRLVAMFPDRDFDAPTRDRYNRVLATEFAEIRDFLILHYHATERRDTAFWRYLADMPVPDRLAEKMRVYAAHGRVFRENEELFSDTSWFAVMHGQGLPTRGYDPVADAVDLATVRRHAAEVHRAIAASADHMPGHRAFLDAHCPADRA